MASMREADVMLQVAEPRAALPIGSTIGANTNQTAYAYAA